jgi:23S rRNA-/tRNA-specific pseudouridylate synthase
MKITRYQDDYFFYFWKPAGIPSTFGKEKSFLDIILSSNDKQVIEIVSYLKDMFTKAEEYGLLNRLDNETS